jgi:DNA gyrase subunit A
MEVGFVHKIDIDREMQQAYLDYAMSVIVSRALPDARDGLKPVHRRILYAMYDMGMRPDSPYKKSARIVGEVLGKYHPHGDMAVYDSMARMAQDFSMRYLLVDGQGNFGSVDGDPPAAMRYTEARMAPPATLMLADIAKNTVNFNPNFDGTLTEPTVLPSALPNLLMNGATGIAVGMATSIPPHNLGEITDAMQFMLQHWDEQDEISIEDLMRFVQGPDFPTGGVIVHSAGGDGLISAYSTGRGRVTIQARAHLEDMDRGRSRIIVTELPYMTNKASLIERIAELARDGKLEGIADLRDESDRQGMRIVIELSKSADPEAMLGDLYKHTPMQTTFSIIMLALVDGEPRLLSLKQALRVYLEHRLEVVRRRSQYDLDKARQRAHILEGLRIALQNLDEVINLIRHSADVETARKRLMKQFKLSEIQAQAILDMPLRRLAALERKKIEEEYKELQAQIKELEALLRSPKKMRQAVSDELNAARDAFNDRRRTHIVELKEGQPRKALLSATEMVPEKNAWLSITPEGLISRSLEDKEPHLSGKEAPAWLARVNSRDTLYLVCEQGEAAALPVHAIPETDNPQEGAPVVKISPLRDHNRLAAVISIPARSGRAAEATPGAEGYVTSVTRQGMVKKSALSELPGPSANTFTLAKVNEGDRLGWVQISTGRNELLLVSAAGMAIRFSEEEVRPMGLAAAGVMGLKLASGDELVGACLLPQAGEVFLVTAEGKAKRVPTDHFPLQGRYGVGVQTWKLAGQERIAGIAVGKGSTRAWLHISRLLPKAIRLDEAPLQTRAARGQAILPLKAGDHVLRLTTAWEMLRPEGEKAPVKPEKAPSRQPRSQAETGKARKPAGAKPPEQMKMDFSDAQAEKPKRAATKKAGSAPAAATQKPGSSAKKAAAPEAARSSSKKAIPPKAEASQPVASAAKTAPAASEAARSSKKAPKPASEAGQPAPSAAKTAPAAPEAAGTSSKKVPLAKSEASQPVASAAKTAPAAPEAAGTSSKKVPLAKSEASQPVASAAKTAPAAPEAAGTSSKKVPLAKSETSQPASSAGKAAPDALEAARSSGKKAPKPTSEAGQPAPSAGKTAAVSPPAGAKTGSQKAASTEKETPPPASSRQKSPAQPPENAAQPVEKQKKGKPQAKAGSQ